MFLMFSYMYMCSLFSFCLVRKHIFMSLLSLEFIVISLLMLFMYNLLVINSSYYLVIYMMVMFVCEGVLGLSVLVSMVRCIGNDYLNSIILW
uniref:NADH dehydrogenase subunit 4L n=1 Tax=Eupelix cuspidata TaxID=139504 RepID=UPI002E77ED10|nr:NADH dehydrogenase subunit 4L [Eupelix cuspidata]WRK21449.1 NADH dehydrogenase subunit 4L [Eupelix cuspidata]